MILHIVWNKYIWKWQITDENGMMFLPDCPNCVNMHRVFKGLRYQPEYVVYPEYGKRGGEIMAEVKRVSITFRVEGEEVFQNEWKVENTSLDKVRKLEMMLIELQSRILKVLG